MAQALDDLAAARVSVWLDDLSRPRILTGSLARMVDGGEIVGITTSPIFIPAIGAEPGYEEQLCDLAHSAEPPEAITSASSSLPYSPLMQN